MHKQHVSKSLNIFVLKVFNSSLWSFNPNNCPYIFSSVWLSQFKFKVICDFSFMASLKKNFLKQKLNQAKTCDLKYANSCVNSEFESHFNFKRTLFFREIIVRNGLIYKINIMLLLLYSQEMSKFEDLRSQFHLHFTRKCFAQSALHTFSLVMFWLCNFFGVKTLAQKVHINSWWNWHLKTRYNSLVVIRYWLVNPGWSTSWMEDAKMAANISRGVKTDWKEESNKQVKT